MGAPPRDLRQTPHFFVSSRAGSGRVGILHFAKRKSSAELPDSTLFPLSSSLFPETASNMSGHDSKASRIAIQIGKPPASSPHEIKQRARPTHGKRHRVQALHEDSESEDNSDNGEQTYGRHETITSYDLHGARQENDRARGRGGSSANSGRGEKEQLEERPRKENGTSHQQREMDSQSRSDGGAADKDNSETQDKPVKWGLTINMKGAGANRDRGSGRSKSRTDQSDSEQDSRKKEKAIKSIDDEALDALTGSRTPKRKHVDSDAADREPGAEDYQAVPIDDFGAHLLRNFGWDGKMRGKVREVTRHANLTGLGAKDLKGAEDLGAWNQKTAKDSRPVRLDDYRREESKKRQRTDDRHRDSYKREREREKEREREHRGRDR